MKREALIKGFEKIAKKMAENRDYLIELDQRNGDGDLGISMSNGFAAAYEAVSGSAEKDLGRLLLLASKTFNEAAPSSLGTILSIGMMGMAKSLRGKEEVDVATLGEAFEDGINNIMSKAGSKPGEKTILDAIVPAIQELRSSADSEMVWKLAAQKAEMGAESTKNMKSVHGRAAYYGEKSLGLVDGGAVAGQLIFAALSEE